MEKLTLKASKRTVVGRKVKMIRHQGNLPANLYGKKITSMSVSVEGKEFADVFAKAGETGLVELLVDGVKHPVLIHNIQYDPVNGLPLHIDFYQVDLKEKVTIKVPLVAIGDAKAVKDKEGVLLHVLSEVEVEALPSDLPEKIEVDVTNLAKVNQAIKVGELTVSSKVKILTDSSLDVVKVAPLVSKEAEAMAKEEAATAAAAAAATAAATPTAEGAAPAPVAKETKEASSDAAKKPPVESPKQ